VEVPLSKPHFSLIASDYGSPNSVILTFFTRVYKAPLSANQTSIDFATGDRVAIFVEIEKKREGCVLFLEQPARFARSLGSKK
jgi:hypothetical protein